jgi:Arc/MetJ-type ribon-helix-helix transcriptional regulator
MSQIAVRLTEHELRLLDEAVADGGFDSRAEAVRVALGLLEAQLREARIAESYRVAHTATTLTSAEAQMLDAAAALVGDALA